MPETLFPHDNPSLMRLKGGLLRNLIPRGKVINKKLEARAFLRPFYMLKFCKLYTHILRTATAESR